MTDPEAESLTLCSRCCEEEALPGISKCLDCVNEMLPDGGEADYCTWCGAEGVELTHALDLERFSFVSRFCSLQCAARWGCAADQDQIIDISQGDPW